MEAVDVSNDINLSSAKNRSVTESEPIVNAEPKLNENENEKFEDGKPEEPTAEDKTVVPEENAEPEWIDILGSGDLKKKVITEGTPDSRPTQGDFVIITFTGRLKDNPNLVIEKEENLEINVGDGEVIQGVDIVLSLMNVGETAQLMINSRFGFGPLGHEPTVPPNASLLYDVTLVEVQEEPYIGSLPLEKRLQVGRRKKNRGNWWYSRKEFKYAKLCYKRAIEYLSDLHLPEDANPATAKSIVDEKLLSYNNLAQCELKLKEYDKALESLDCVFKYQPNNVKALYRKSIVLKSKGDVEGSISAIKAALLLEETPLLKQELKILIATKKKDIDNQKSLYKKMLGSEKSLPNNKNPIGNKKQKSSGISAKYFVIPAVAAVLIMAIYKYQCRD